MTSVSASTEQHQAVQAVVEEEEEEEESVDIMDGPTHGLQGHNVMRTAILKHMQGLRKNTPQTNMPEAVTSPDITILCEKCQDYVNLLHLIEHRHYHKALAIMKYGKKLQNQLTAEMLLKRRNAILKKIKQNHVVGSQIEPREIQKINEAYEFLKADIDGTLAQLHQMKGEIDVNVHGSSLNCSPHCIYAVGFCSSANSRWKNHMEDTKVYQDAFGEDENKCYMAIFDGHHGRFAADVAASELHHMLLNEMKKFDPKTISTVAKNMAENGEDISNYHFERPTTKESEREVLYEGSMTIVEQIIRLCEDKYDEMMTPRSGRSSKALESERSQEQLAAIEEEKSDQEKTPDGDKTPRKKKTIKPLMAAKMEDAFKKSYQLLDILLSYGKDECSRVRWSGCSATTLVLQGVDPDKVDRDWVISPVKEEDEGNDVEITARKLSGYEEPKTLGLIHLANAGNVHCVLVRGNQSYRITRDHTPNNAKESKRVLKSGGDISESKKEKRVNGVLGTTRGLGNHGDVKLKKCVMVEPSTTLVPIDQYAQFLILASHGVWEVFTPQEASSLLLKLLPSNFVPIPSKISTTLKPLIEDANSQYLTTSHSNVTSSIAKHHHHDNKATEKEEKEYIISPLIEENLRKMEDKTPDTEADLKTEVGSRMDESGDESGNEADIDTYGDYLSIPTFSRMSNLNPNQSRDMFHREFAKVMAEHLVQAALQAGARDNISVSIALLPGCGL